jgi:hypothetical protein
MCVCVSLSLSRSLSLPGTSDQSFIIEILGLDDTVADEDSPKFYWDDLVSLNEAAQVEREREKERESEREKERE